MSHNSSVWLDMRVLQVEIETQLNLSRLDILPQSYRQPKEFFTYIYFFLHIRLTARWVLNSLEAFYITRK